MVAELTRPPRRNWTEKRVIHLEEAVAWRRVHGLTDRLHYATVAERPDVIAQSTAELRAIADRRLRQLNGGNDAA